jgi:hypothetical protein
MLVYQRVNHYESPHLSRLPMISSAGYHRGLQRPRGVAAAGTAGALSRERRARSSATPGPVMLRLWEFQRTYNICRFPEIVVPLNIEFSIINKICWGSPIFGNTHIKISLEYDDIP